MADYRAEVGEPGKRRWAHVYPNSSTVPLRSPKDAIQHFLNAGFIGPGDSGTLERTRETKAVHMSGRSSRPTGTVAAWRYRVDRIGTIEVVREDR